MMATEVKFIKIIITGWTIAIILFTLIALSARSRLAASNRLFSLASLLKARITLIPVRFSRRTRLTLSSLICMALNKGTIYVARTAIRSSITGRTTARIRVSCLSLE